MEFKSKILIGLILIFAFSCSNDDDTDINQTIFFWNQTKCGDPWNTGENDPNAETEIAITDFLENENITVVSVEFDNNSPLDVTCESCGCGTGQRIIVDVISADISKMLELDFYQ